MSGLKAVPGFHKSRCGYSTSDSVGIIFTWAALVVGDDPLAALLELANVVVVAVHGVGFDAGGRAANGMAAAALGGRCDWPRKKGRL